MKKYKVSTYHSLIVEAETKEDALDKYYDQTDGTESKEKVILIRKRR